MLFLVLDIAGTLAQRALGPAGFYAVSAAGGLVSSASSVASAGALAGKGAVAANSAAFGAVLASLMSAIVNLPLVWRVSGQRSLTARLARATAVIALLGITRILLQSLLLARH